MKTSKPTILFTLVLGSLAFWLGGCAHEPPLSPTGPPPAVRLGAELGLASFRTSHDWVTVLLDKQGSAHVLVAADAPREVYHIVVSPDGEVQRERVATGQSASAISAAFDSAGRLHVLMNDTHWVRGTAGWTVEASTPWGVAAIDVRQPRLVQGRDGLVWTFLVKGKEVGSKGRWDWYAFGGAFAAIVFPWHSDSEKLVVVSETGTPESLWFVLDPQDNRDARNFLSAVDDQGNLYVVYAASRTAFVTEEQPRYVQIELNEITAREEPLPSESPRAIKLYPVSGKPVLSLQPGVSDLGQAAVAVDPESGRLLLVRAHQPAFTLDHGAWSPPLRLPLPHFWEPRLSPAGHDAFHVMTVTEGRVLYLLCKQDGCSAPAEVGTTQVAGTFGSTWDALGMASAGQNQAFLVWPSENGIVGRWVQGIRDIEAEPRQDLLTLSDGSSIPNALRDFANGKVRLVTPGWTSGLTEAAAAISHSSLAKQLHDGGQWESLALLVLTDNYGDDLRWYFLGRAAEGMALCDPAVVYYTRSRERSEKFVTRCKSIGSGPCGGFDLPQDLDARFRAIEIMRADGKCLTPSAQALPTGH